MRSSSRMKSASPQSTPSSGSSRSGRPPCKAAGCWYEPRRRLRTEPGNRDRTLGHLPRSGSNAQRSAVRSSIARGDLIGHFKCGTQCLRHRSRSRPNSARPPRGRRRGRCRVPRGSSICDPQDFDENDEIILKSFVFKMTFLSKPIIRSFVFHFRTVI